MIGHTLCGMTARYGSVQDATLRRTGNETGQMIANYWARTPSTVLPFRNLGQRATLFK
jgi:hypothetical protein